MPLNDHLHKWKMIVAILVYFCMFIMMIVPDTATAYDRFLNIIMCMLLFGIPIILLTNAGNIRDKLPVFNKRSLKFNILGGFLAAVIIITGIGITNGLKSPEQIRLESVATQQRTIKKTVSDLDSRIEKLGDVNNLTLSNATSVSDARKAYESLTSEGQALVTKIAVLESAEKKITDLQTAEKLAAEKVAAEKAASASSSSSGSASTTVTSPTPARSPSNSYTVYITKTGEKYHRAGCRYLSRSQISISKADAISSGYTPCSVCNP